MPRRMAYLSACFASSGSSSQMRIPGTLVSKFELIWGMSMPRFSVPKTRVMAPCGQGGRQAPCPMQWVGLIRTALPRINPMACSGQAVMQVPAPMHLTGLITGCNEGGSVRPAIRFSLYSCSAASSVFLRFSVYTINTTKNGSK